MLTMGVLSKAIGSPLNYGRWQSFLELMLAHEVGSSWRDEILNSRRGQRRLGIRTSPEASRDIVLTLLIHL